MARILIVEDSPTQAARLRLILEDQKHAVDAATTGTAALERLQNADYDLVVTDIIMPGMSGYELCKSVKALPKERRPLVVLLSTLGDPMDIIRGLECGADNYITKPYEPDVLISRINLVLEHKRIRAMPRQDDAIDIAFMGQKFTINSEKEQILDLLISTFEDILRTHKVLQSSKTELAAQNAIVETTLQNLDHGVLVVDSGMQISFMNKHIHDLFGIPPENLTVGMDIEIFLQRWAQELGVAQTAIESEIARLRSREPSRLAFSLPGGRSLEYRQGPLPYGGFVRTYTDITEEVIFQQSLQEAKERAEEAVRTKASFLATMSHEIRTPMNGVVGIVELLRSTALSSEQKEMVGIVHQSALSLLDVINDILDFSKIEAGKLKIEQIAMSLTETVEAAAEVVAAHTQSKYLDIICSIDPYIDSVVLGDPLRVRQVLMNIMSNAVKFTETGMVAVDVSAEAIAADSISVLFEVTDTGIGIDPQTLAKLFQPFAQADRSTTRKYGGTGLGLIICKSLVEQMGGDIGVRSEVGKGSTFWVKIPFTRHPDAVQRAGYLHYKNALAGVRALVCDRARSRSAAASYLSAAGAEVLESDSIDGAVSVLRRAQNSGRPIDMAIVNYRIGEDSALNFVQAMNKYPELDGIKLVLIAPHRNASAAQISRAAPFAASVSMPLHRAKLYDVVCAVAGRDVVTDGSTDDASQLEFEAPSASDAAAKHCLILVAEDNLTNQLVIKSQLKRLGFAAEYVNDGREAWEALSGSEASYGLLLTDCHMPFVDGYTLAGMVRDREQNTGKRLPIVALTANALQGEADVCRAAGMDDYLSKPAELKALNAMILKWMPDAGGLRRLAAEPQQQGGAESAVSAGAPTVAPPIDVGALARLLGNDDPAYIAEMLSMFWETMEDTPRKLATLARARDSANLAGAAHAAKGAAASAGAQRLAALMQSLQGLAGKEEWAQVKTLTPQIDQEFSAIQKFIKELHTEGAGISP